MLLDDLEQKLVFAAIRQMEASNFKLDFGQIAEELGITDGKDDKGAAAKRWARLKLKYGLASASAKVAAKESTPKKSKKSKKSKKPAKKDLIKQSDEVANEQPVSKKRKLNPDKDGDEE
ncbi:hypothetical protein DSL72_008389 [Monilinia vaccinii-corymbosi]|uniref:Myb-like DNA-binding domain-containing protein n=1 Tax=Monilinia vaccinii-corymbosi TaxID=61207 RepID=A0A8A3PKK9_9HELO|nr:hypothetical protein DSL72_008389 [Monilinia vaccinii-corymbosi]